MQTIKAIRIIPNEDQSDDPTMPFFGVLRAPRRHEIVAVKARDGEVPTVWVCCDSEDKDELDTLCAFVCDGELIPDNYQLGWMAVETGLENKPRICLFKKRPG